MRPNLETLNKYAEHIRHLCFCRIEDIAFYSVRCSRLTFLEVENSFIRYKQPPEQLPAIAGLIQRNSGTLERLTLVRYRDVPSVALWKSLSQCRKLRRIQVQYGLVSLQDMEAFWEACSKTNELFLDKMDLAIGTDSPTMFLPETFPKLSNLRLVSIRGFDNPRYRNESIIDKGNPEGLARLHRQQQLEQEQAFRQLSRLTRLRGLDISDPDGRRQSLKFRLKSRGGELDQLESLKRLDWIQFGNAFQDLSENELDWMIGHWPKFVGLHGKYHEDES
ncbi:hypothetical protein BGZ79_007348 [Entomortierella chlamydospora]|nr:hypothetical protein BGZ79_007348 [Entomortierella chlamydospora]